MSRVTQFAARDPGPAARVAGFVAHLRLNGLRLGVSESETALRALTHVAACDPAEARAALKAVCASCAEDAGRFDDLFDAYWMNGGRIAPCAAPAQGATKPAPQGTRSTRAAEGMERGATGRPDAPDDTGDDAGDGHGDGKLVAVRAETLMRRDLRDVVSAQDIAEATRVAERIGRAIRDRRSRRHRAASTGARIDLRRTLRRSLATGGEPIHLPRRTRPDRPARFVTLCDVSGSMQPYARPFLAFVAGLMRFDPTSDAYLFHTRLVRITEALRDPDPLRAMNRLTLLSDGFGGGSRIGAALAQFAAGQARRAVDGRTVVFILSDGYDSGGADDIAGALGRLKRRGGRIVWLNPLKGWKDYAPVARGMAAALPHLDGFHAANTLAALGALETELVRL